MALAEGGREQRTAAGLSYAEWTKRLCTHFFHEGRAGQPVTFFVDDDLLGELEGSGDPEAGVESVTVAVKSRISPDSYGRRFTKIDAESTKWKVDGADGCPPSLPLLAVAVLAGTRMAREDGIGANNYWKRFRDLLDFDSSSDTRGINEVLPGLWDQLSWWLDEKHQGRLGHSTIEEHSWWTIIGYALSQALFRESDRQQLTELFRRLGLTPGEEVDPSELLQYFKAWAPTSSLSAGARHMAADTRGRYDQRLAAILADEEARWDGVLRDEHGRRVGSLLLAYEPVPRPTYFLAAERPIGFPDTALFSDGSWARELTASAEGWYAETWPLEADWLAKGLRLLSGDFVLGFRPAEIIPLARNQELGCWASTTQVQPGEKYAVLASSGQAAAVKTFLQRHALDGWEPKAPEFAPSGWVLFTNVVIEQSVESPPAGPVAVLAPAVRERPTMKGGLLLEGGTRLYLQGGEPDIWLPSLLGDGYLVKVDGAVAPTAPGQRLTLADRGLPLGGHEVSVGLSLLNFSTTKALRRGEPPRTGTIGHRLSVENGGYRAVSAGAAAIGAEHPGEIAVVGAMLKGDRDALPDRRETVILPLAARAYRLVGAAPGEVLEPVEPSRPKWLDGVGDDGLFPIGFEVAADFEVVWVTYERADGTVSARARSRKHPQEAEAGVDPRAMSAWRSAFTMSPRLREEDAALWELYRAAATRITAVPNSVAPLERRRSRSEARATDPTARGAARRKLVGHGLVLDLAAESDLLRVYRSPDHSYAVVLVLRTGRWKVSDWPEGADQGRVVGTYDSLEAALAAIRARLDGQPRSSASGKYDLLLRWASECGSGTWGQFRDAHDWLFNAGQQEGREVKASTTIHALSLLGHLESDWESGNWAIAPTALTILPNAGGHAVLSGARHDHLLSAFKRGLADEDMFSITDEQEWGPSAIFIAAADEQAVEQLAQQVGIAFESSVSERIARLLPPLRSYLDLCRSTPGARGYGIERFDVRLLAFRRADNDAGPGLYRYDTWGRPEFRFVDDEGSYYRLDWALGIHAELWRNGLSEIRYQPDSVNGTLQVPFRAQLPSLHARAAVLCCGLMPALDNWRWRYPNVPLDTAQAIARSLGQELRIEQGDRNG